MPSQSLSVLQARTVGHHEVSGQRVAIKILNKKRIKEMDMGEKVRREIKNLRRLDHPHIIRLYVHLYAS